MWREEFCLGSVLAQKARINWNQQGDDSISFFYASLKDKTVHKHIDLLIDEVGNRLEDNKGIGDEALQFYKKLMGARSHRRKRINLHIMRKRNQLSDDDAFDLIKPVDRKEIEDALFSIDSFKALGLDGFNAYFFKKSWCVIENQFCDAIQDYFNTAIMHKKVNIATITLIPKVYNATSIVDFRPITCCTIIYKTIAKSLTNRLQKVIASVMSETQSGFIPGRTIADNILLASELMRGYNTRFNSSKCMFKMDLRKAYDSVDWDFMDEVLREMSFPISFIDWVMGCVKTVSYSVLINGRPLRPFDAA